MRVDPPGGIHAFFGSLLQKRRKVCVQQREQRPHLFGVSLVAVGSAALEAPVVLKCARPQMWGLRGADWSLESERVAKPTVGWSRWAPRVVKVRRPPPRLTERAMDGWDDPYELRDDEMELNDDSQGG